MRLSPDGTRVALDIRDQDRDVWVWDFMLQTLTRLTFFPGEDGFPPIPGTEITQGDVFNPVFSADGASIAYMSLSGGTTTIHRSAVSGGTPVTVSRLATTTGPGSSPNGMSWGADGLLFDEKSRIMRVSANGGTPELLVSFKNNEEAHGPRMLPGGQAVLFTLAAGTGAGRWDGAHIVVHSLASGEQKTLIEGGSDARYLPTGHIVYARGRHVIRGPVRRAETGGHRWSCSDC
jgi:Tol biopolymer transport system component